MEPILDIKQIGPTGFLRHLRMSFPQSYSKIRDNWEQKVNGGKIIRSGNISRKLAKMIKIGARDGLKFKSLTKGKVKYFGDFIRWLAGRPV